jgi:MerR family transcriptional regulator, Zn(II)-responsive regulator of zntA
MNNRAAGSVAEASSGEGRRADGLLTTGDMARVTGNTLRTVRFYEEAGILNPDRRSAGGHRLFGQCQLDRLQFITDMRAANLSLDEIRALLELKEKADSGQEAAASACDALDGQIEAVRGKIEVFQRLLNDLTQARELIDKCRDCSNDRKFPEGCGDCTVMKQGAPASQSLRVLWGLNGGGVDAPVADGD